MSVTAGDFYFRGVHRGPGIYRPPPSAFFSSPFEFETTYPMTDADEKRAAVTLSPPTEREPDPRRDRITQPPDPDEDAKAAALYENTLGLSPPTGHKRSTMIPPKDGPLERLLTETQEGRRENAAAFKSLGAELGTIRNEAQRTGQRMTGVEKALDALRTDTTAELAQMKKGLRGALRRLAALEKIEASRKAHTRDPAQSSAPPSAEPA